MRLNRSTFIIAVLSGYLLLLTGCSKKDALPTDPFDSKKALTLKNEKYGAGARNTVDIYLPANRSVTATKCVVLLHGGSWIAGDKADLATVVPLLQQALPDVAILNTNYTLADGSAANSHPAQMKDIKTLVSYVASKATLWNVRQNFSLVGVSAGGHLSLLYAYSYDTTKQIRFVGSIVGPTNITDNFYTGNVLFQSIFASYLGKTYAAAPELYRQLSPALGITNTAPPTYMAYGGSDPLVPLSNPTLLKEKLVALGIPHRYDLYPSESHEFSTTAVASTIVSLAQFYKSQVP
jgi:acetyl esterase/lipase